MHLSKDHENHKLEYGKSDLLKVERGICFEHVIFPCAFVRYFFDKKPSHIYSPGFFNSLDPKSEL
jgi:hypothetical protein